MLGFSLGVLAGILIANFSVWIVARRLRSGTLRIDRSDPLDQPYMFLELSESVSSVSNKKFVILKVNTKNYISHE